MERIVRNSDIFKSFFGCDFPWRLAVENANKIIRRDIPKGSDLSKYSKHFIEALAIVIVEHNIKSLLEIVHRAYVLDKGKVAKEGEPKELMKNGILEKVFLGKLE